MNVLITAATDKELQAVKLNLKGCQIDWQLTGVGGVATCYHLMNVLSKPNSYDLVINIGIAGSFKTNLPIGSVAIVQEDCFADLGVETGHGFASMFSLNMGHELGCYTDNGGLFCNKASQVASLIQIPLVKGISVNTCSGQKSTIDMRQSIFDPDIETMEGAAFFYTCIKRNYNFLALRAISNKVEIRNRDHWNIDLALQQLGITLKILLEQQLLFDLK